MRLDNFVSRLDEFPPCLIRLLAREPGQRRRPLSYRQIAVRSGLPIQKIYALSKLPSWRNVPTGLVEPFMKGCGIDPSCLWRQRDYVRRTYSGKIRSPMAHLEGLS